MTEQKSVNDLTLKEATAEIGPLKAQLLQWLQIGRAHV